MSEHAANGQPSVDVLVVGAGPTGLTLACDLARRGVTARVVDKAREPFGGSRGKGLQPRTLEVFDDLGVIDAVLAAGSEYPRLRVHAGWLAFPWDMQHRAKRTSNLPYPNTWLLPQARTEAILRARLAELGGGVELGTELSSFEQDPGGVTARLACGGAVEQVRARYLVGADGGHSVVRKALGVHFVGQPLEGARAVVGDVRVDDLDRRFWHVWPWARSGPVALCPLPHGDRFQLFAPLPGAADLELTESSVRELVLAAIGRSAPRLRDPSWLSLYRPSVRLVDRYREGRVFLAGDAAHVHPATGGQGLNVGVQDAYNLGWKLAAALQGAPAALLGTYEEERRPVAAGVLGLSTALHHRKWQRRGDATKQLRTTYRGSSLAAEASGSATRVRAGDRASDAICSDGQGGAVRLFDVLRGPRVTLLAFGESARRAAAEECAGRGVRVIHVVASRRDTRGEALVDGDRGLQRTYDVGEGSLVLIRPDGYVGVITRAPSAAVVGRYLDRIGPPVLATASGRSAGSIARLTTTGS